LGVARLQQIFLRTLPPESGKESVKHLRGHIRTVLRATIRKQKWPKAPHVIGSSGTVRALARMCKRNTDREIHRKWLEKLIRTMTPLSLKQIQDLPGMDPKRADLMLAGTLVLEECLRILGAKSASATEFSLRDGILDQERSLLEPSRKSQRWDLEPYLEKAVHYGEERNRLRWLVGSALRLFRRLRSIHKLDDSWFPYLALAVMFRNTGRQISPTGYENHSAYLVQNGELPLSESWEIKFVAQLCLLHNNSKANLEKLPFRKGPSKSKGAPFAKLLALLRIVDALDSAFPKRVEAERIETKGRTVRLWLSHGDSTELAVLRLQQKKALFEKVFEKTLLAQIR
jgi:exopolyphosphatase/guanosine-5'-triphosphate,3'-diphosphate pyrophosphatase